MWKFIARGVFYLLAAVTLGWTASLTYSFVSGVLPSMPIASLLSLFVFDLGMLAWLIVFLRHAEGGGQRGVALIGTLFDFTGVALMAIAEIFLGGQKLVAAPERLGEYALWGIGIWTVANVGMVLAFHLLSPSARREMAIKDAQDSITERAFEQLKTRTNEIAEQVAGKLSLIMADDVVRELIARNGATPSMSQAQTLLSYNLTAEAMPAIEDAPKTKATRNGRKPEEDGPK